MRAVGTVESWAWDFIHATKLEQKLEPPAPPPVWEEGAAPRRASGPGRPPEIRVVAKAPKSPASLRDKAQRAQLLHTFIHHELQAAELMCWAILAFPEAPAAMKRGLLGVCQDELRHIGMYRAHLRALGQDYGEHPVTDWFWQRVPQSTAPAHFMAAMGMGLEGGNLDHTRRFEELFRQAGDEEGARVHAQVGEEEIPHVRFGLHWFRALTGDVLFQAWREHLPAPLTPMIMRGKDLDLEKRRRAGYPEEFLRELERWRSGAPGS
jgi:uncharacterized ferritin-like protein (DUF455 family)